MKEKVTIQALVTLPTSSTPSTQTLQKPSIDATPLEISIPILSWSKAEEVIQYGDVSLNEEIIFPTYEYDIITIEKMDISKQGLTRKKNQEILRRKHMQK